MTDPFRLRVLKNLTGILQEITPANGFQHDLSQAVFRGRSIFGHGDPQPMVSILESPAPLGNSSGGGDNTAVLAPWELLIQGFAADDRYNPTDPAHLLMADVKLRLATERKKAARRNTILDLDGRVDQMVIGSGVVRPPDEEVSEVAYFWLTLSLTIVEDMQNPFE